MTGSPDGKVSPNEELRKRISPDGRTSPNEYPPSRGPTPCRENSSTLATRTSNTESKNNTQKATKVTTVYLFWIIYYLQNGCSE